MCASGDFWSSRATGVPHIATLCFSVGRKSSRLCAVDPLVPSCPRGVGHEPEPLAFMRGTNGGRVEQTPFRIEPEVGKVSEDMG